MNFDVIKTALAATNTILENVSSTLEAKRLADKRRDGARRACRRLRAKIADLEAAVGRMKGAAAEAEAARAQRDDFLNVLSQISRGEADKELIRLRQMLGEIARGKSVSDGVKFLIDNYRNAGSLIEKQRNKFQSLASLFGLTGQFDVGEVVKKSIEKISSLEEQLKSVIKEDEEDGSQEESRDASS